VYRSDRFVECRENPRRADRCRDVMSVHVGPKVRTDTCEDNADPLACQIIEQITYALRSGAVLCVLKTLSQTNPELAKPCSCAGIFETADSQNGKLRNFHLLQRSSYLEHQSNLH
jgi:hypothetical protein